jgi:hypothetical protein
MGCLRLTGTETNVNPFLRVQSKMEVKSKKGVNYYPFGLAIDALSWERDDATGNRFLYNGKELQDELDLGWYVLL